MTKSENSRKSQQLSVARTLIYQPSSYANFCHHSSYLLFNTDFQNKNMTIYGRTEIRLQSSSEPLTCAGVAKVQVVQVM